MSHEESPKFQGERDKSTEGLRFPLGHDPRIPARQGTGWEQTEPRVGTGRDPGTGPVPGNRGWARAFGTVRLLAELGRGWSCGAQEQPRPAELGEFPWLRPAPSVSLSRGPGIARDGSQRDSRRIQRFPTFPCPVSGSASASSSFTGSGIPRDGPAPTRVPEESGAFPPFQAGSRDPRSSPGAASAPRLGLLTTVN